jgi:lysophospholipase L1-like esterase
MLGAGACGTANDESGQTKTAQMTENTQQPQDEQEAEDAQLSGETLSTQEAQGNQNAAETSTEREPLPLLTSYVNDDEMDAADMWSSCEDAALAKVMRKAESGEPVTIACIGGSITQGTIAKGTTDSEVGFSTPYAELFHKWWSERFPDTEVNFINAGIGGTDSYLGVHRVERDVLQYQPDLVLVEYAVNDADSFFYKRSYDNLVRKILESDSAPAVMLLFMAQTDGTSAQDMQVLVGYNYALPMVSYANCIKSMMENGRYTAEQLSGDGVHPSALGHAIAGEILWNYLNQVYGQMYELDDPKPFDLAAVTDERYKNAEIVDATLEQALQEPAETGAAGTFELLSSGTFEQESASEYFPNGWGCREGDGNLEFTGTFRNLGVLYLATTDGKSGIFDIWIDGECVWSINADFTGGWGNAITAKEVYTSDMAAEHTIVIKKSPDSEGDVFHLLGLLAS